MSRARSRRGCHGTDGGHEGADDGIAVRLLGPDDARDARLAGEVAPHLAPLLATPCDLEVHEKPLRP